MNDPIWQEVMRDSERDGGEVEDGLPFYVFLRRSLFVAGFFPTPRSTKSLLS